MYSKLMLKDKSYYKDTYEMDEINNPDFEDLEEEINFNANGKVIIEKNKKRKKSK